MGRVSANRFKSGISREQVGAIKTSVELGRVLQKEHPEILEQYKGGKNHVEIARGLLSSIALRGHSERIIVNSVSYALRGYKGRFQEQYPGLAAIEELDELAKRDILRNAIRIGERARAEGLGICGLALEQRQATGRKAGLKGGSAARDRKVGIHSLTKESLRACSLKGLLAKGGVPWVQADSSRPSEIEFAYSASRLPENQHPEGSRYVGKPNWHLITSLVNNVFHNGQNVRIRDAIISALTSLKRAKESEKLSRT